MATNNSTSSSSAAAPAATSPPSARRSSASTTPASTSGRTRRRQARRLGGTCTNVGCIPSKALLQSSEHFEHAGHALRRPRHRRVKGLTIDVAKMLAARTRSSSRTTTASCTCSRRTRSRSSTAAARSSKAADGGYEIKVAGAKPRRSTAQARHRRHRLERRARCPARAFDEERILSNDGALRDRRGAEDAGRDRRRRDRPRDGLGLAPPRRRGHGARRRCRPSSARSTSRSPRKRRRLFAKQGLKIELGVKIGEVKAGKKGVTVDYTDAKGDGADAATCDKLIVSIGRVPQHHRPERRSGRPEARRARLHRGRRRVPHQPAERLGDRRRRARPDARAQGRGRGRGGGRAHRRPARPRRLQHHPVGDLHLARRSPGSARPSSSSRPTACAYKAGTLPVHGQRPRARAGRHHRHGQVPGRRRRPTRSSACTSSARWLSELISEAVVAMEFRPRRRHRAHLPRAPVAVRSDQGSGAGGRQAHAELLSSVAHRAPAAVLGPRTSTKPSSPRAATQSDPGAAARGRRAGALRRTSGPTTRRSARNALQEADQPARRSRAASTCTAASAAARAS